MAPGIQEEEGVIRGPMNEANQKALIEAAAKKKRPSKPMRENLGEENAQEPGPSRGDVDLGRVNESSGEDTAPEPSRKNVNEETGVR